MPLHPPRASRCRCRPTPPPNSSASAPRSTAGRLEWQDCGEPAAHIPVENYLSDDDPRRRDRAPVPAAAADRRPRQRARRRPGARPRRLRRAAAARRATPTAAFAPSSTSAGIAACASSPRHGKAEPRASVVCPYHGWTYRLDGALRHRLHAEAFDDCERAPTRASSPCRAKSGTACSGSCRRRSATIDVAAWLDGLDAELPFFGIDRLRHFRTDPRRVPGQLEADRRRLPRGVSHPRAAQGDDLSVLRRRPDRRRPLRPAHPVAGRAPRRRGVGARRRARSPADMAACASWSTPSHVIFPNTITIFHPDYLSLVTLYPVGRRDAVAGRTAC